MSLTPETIRPPDGVAIARCQQRLDCLTKPAGSLGRLEELALRLSGLIGFPPTLDHAAVLIFAGDHGVTVEGVSAFPKEVTPQMVLNFLRGGAAINVLARQADARVTVIDVGVDAELTDVISTVTLAPHTSFHSAKVRRGTRNFVREDALTADELAQAVAAGRAAAERSIESGARVLCLGEMGIGNTTAAAALTSLLLPLDPELSVGRGTGVDNEGLERKRNVVTRALQRYRFALQTSTEPHSAQRALAALGGLEIAALCGAMLGAAARGRPVLVDGFICSAAALAALRMQPEVAPYLFFSHCSTESGHQHLLQGLGVRPLLNLDLRLGEGTGAVLALPLLRSACAILTEMATFESAKVASSL